MSWRRGSELKRRIKVSQTCARRPLPLFFSVTESQYPPIWSNLGQMEHLTPPGRRRLQSQKTNGSPMLRHRAGLRSSVFNRRARSWTPARRWFTLSPATTDQATTATVLAIVRPYQTFHLRALAEYRQAFSRAMSSLMSASRGARVPREAASDGDAATAHRSYKLERLL